ncbi:hypothetical protein [Pseudogemmobacter sp. W21_MBD1_M6]|uniref:hypothetical protein n=1 Tax=Pseudogemmobacter sp. W21_MBD1_M6 TaxID=3240271 RepID=UPI003F9622F6
MKTLVTLTASLMLVGALANAAVTDDVIADLQSQGFTNNIELRVKGSQIKATASNGTDTINAVYGADGQLISSDTGPSGNGGTMPSGARRSDEDDDDDRNGSDDHDGDDDDHGDDHDGGDDDGGDDHDGGDDDGGDDHGGGDDDGGDDD